MLKNKTLLSTALVAGFGFLAMAAAPAHAASSGTINFSGRVLADSCTISVNGGSTVVLPLVTTTDFASTVGSTAGTTSPFTVKLTGCDTSATSAEMRFSGTQIDATTGNLANSATAGSNVEVQLLDNSNNVINTKTQANAPSISIDHTNGNGSTQLKARYISTSASTTAGLVQSSVGFTLTYL